MKNCSKIYPNAMYLYSSKECYIICWHYKIIICNNHQNRLISVAQLIEHVKLFTLLSYDNWEKVGVTLNYNILAKTSQFPSQ